MSEKYVRPAWMPLTKGFVIAIAAIIIKYLTSLSCLAIYSQESIVSDIPNFAVCIVIFISSLFIYNSIYGLALSFDRASADEYFEKQDDFEGEHADFKRIYYHRSFLLTAIPIIVIEAVAAACGSSWEIPGMFYFGEGRSRFSSSGGAV